MRSLAQASANTHTQSLFSEKEKAELYLQSVAQQNKEEVKISQLIESAIKLLESSPSAKNILDYLKANNVKIVVVDLNVYGAKLKDSKTVQIDRSYLQDLVGDPQLNSGSQTVAQIDAATTIAHEINHAILVKGLESIGIPVIPTREMEAAAFIQSELILFELTQTKNGMTLSDESKRELIEHNNGVRALALALNKDSLEDPYSVANALPGGYEYHFTISKEFQEFLQDLRKMELKEASSPEKVPKEWLKITSSEYDALQKATKEWLVEMIKMAKQNYKEPQ